MVASPSTVAGLRAAAGPPSAVEQTRLAVRGAERWQWLLTVAVFAGTFVFRFVDLEFDNDHFRMITQGRQVAVMGELPVRDFDDPGIVLQIFTSAGLQRLFGYNLLGQAFFDVLVLALAATLTFRFAARLSGSSWLGLFMTLLAVLMYPRLKQHQVILLPLLGLLACWAYADRRDLRRLVALGLVTALAFLLRHDQGVYVGVAAAVTLLSVHWSDGPRLLVRRALIYGLAAFLPLLPFFAFLQLNGGVFEYFRSASDYVESERRRQGALRRPAFIFDARAPWFSSAIIPAGQIRVAWDRDVTLEERAELEQQYRLANPRPFTEDGRITRWEYDLMDGSEQNVRAMVRDRRIDDTDGVNRRTYEVRSDNDPLVTRWRRAIPIPELQIFPGLIGPVNAIPWLYHVFLAAPLAAILVLAWRRLRNRSSPDTPKLLAVALLVLAVQPSIRDPLADRLADVVAPIAILGAWLLSLWLRGRAGALRFGAALLVLGLTASSILAIAESGSRLRKARELPGPAELVQQGSDMYRELSTTPPIETRTAGAIRELRLARYVQACTKPDDRLLVTWFAPELYFYSGRGLAGRQLFWFRGYGATDAQQQREIEKLRSHSVPIVVTRLDRGNDVQAFRQVQAYLDHYYREAPLTRPGSVGSQYRVMTHVDAAPVGIYEPLGLPCFVPGSGLAGIAPLPVEG